MSDARPRTESADPATSDLDRLQTGDLVRVLIAAHRGAVDAVAACDDSLAAVVGAVVERLRAGGVLHYVGAGTSGRLAVLDAAECPPTFGTPPALVCAHIAGGSHALTQAVEGAEDDRAAAKREFSGHVKPADAVVGLSASGRAPYVLAALEVARERGALTIAFTSAASAELLEIADQVVEFDTGPEPLAGSTRLRAGTAQKIALNTLSTAVMVRLGKVHDNLMVDVVPTNEKLRKRAVRLVCLLCGVNEDAASGLLVEAGGNVKVAAVMRRRGLDANQARALLAGHDGVLRLALEEGGKWV